MAIQKNTQFVGRIENLIYYKSMDRYCIRTVPKQMRQSEATKQAARNFGLIYSRSKILRSLAGNLIADPRDRAMQARLRKALSEALKLNPASTTDALVQPLLGFAFNEALPLGECLRFPIEMTGQPGEKIRIEIPAINPMQSITAPPDASRVQLEFIALSFSFEHERTVRSAPQILNIPLTDSIQPPLSLELEALTEKPCILLVVLAVSYWNEDRRIMQGEYNPVEVTGVF